MYNQYSKIAFPFLNLEIDPDRFLKIGPLTIYIYGILIATGLHRQMTEEEMEQHRPLATRMNVQQAFQGKKPNTGKNESDATDGTDGPPISESHFLIKEEAEILINEKGEIIGEKLRRDLPR